jgi:hypothetical protein
MTCSTNAFGRWGRRKVTVRAARCKYCHAPAVRVWRYKSTLARILCYIRTCANHVTAGESEAASKSAEVVR